MELTTEREVQAYYEGKRTGVRAYAWWRDGSQYVGTTVRTLREACNEITRHEDIAILDVLKYRHISTDGLPL